MDRLFVLSLVLFATAARAVEDTPPQGLTPVPDVPDMPPPVESGETMEPDITIIKKGKDTIEEYRVHNRLYMVKIKPAVGPAYYLIDSDGDGTMDRRRGTLEEGMQIPQWVLFSW